MNQYSNTQLIADMKRNPSLSREDNDRLYDLVKAGDAVAWRTMVEGNMYLVVDKVNCFLRRHSHATHLRDDLTSAGSIGLLTAVNAIARGEVEKMNITGYLAVGIGRELEVLMDSENTIFVSKQCRWYARKQGCELDIPVVQALPPTNYEQCGDLTDGDEVADSQGAGDESYDPSALVEIRDILAACCTSDEERQYVRMREESYTYQEIADSLGIPKGSVHAMKERLYERFLRKSGLTPR